MSILSALLFFHAGLFRAGLFITVIIAIWGLDLQFGTTGINNFAYIVFQAAGAYTAAILTLGPHTSNGGFQSYVGGTHLPFPLPMLAGAAAGGVLAVPIGLLGLRRLRRLVRPR